MGLEPIRPKGRQILPTIFYNRPLDRIRTYTESVLSRLPLPIGILGGFAYADILSIP
jgi:hypothetical protein